MTKYLYDHLSFDEASKLWLNGYRFSDGGFGPVGHTRELEKYFEFLHVDNPLGTNLGVVSRGLFNPLAYECEIDYIMRCEEKLFPFTDSKRGTYHTILVAFRKRLENYYDEHLSPNRKLKQGERLYSIEPRTWYSCI